MTDKPEEAGEPIIGYPTEPITYTENPTTHDELRHSVHIHLAIMNGPSQQLAVLLVKVLDFVPKYENKHAAKVYAPDAISKLNADIEALAFSIVEAVAIHVHRSIDDRAAKAAQRGDQFPKSVRQKGDNILVMLGRHRSDSDQIAAKNSVLKAIAEALRALSTVTKAKYPDIKTSRGLIL